MHVVFTIYSFILTWFLWLYANNLDSTIAISIKRDNGVIKRYVEDGHFKSDVLQKAKYDETYKGKKIYDGNDYGHHDRQVAYKGHGVIEHNYEAQGDDVYKYRLGGGAGNIGAGAGTGYSQPHSPGIVIIGNVGQASDNGFKHGYASGTALKHNGYNGGGTLDIGGNFPGNAGESPFWSLGHQIKPGGLGGWKSGHGHGRNSYKERYNKIVKEDSLVKEKAHDKGSHVAKHESFHNANDDRAAKNLQIVEPKYSHSKGAEEYKYLPKTTLQPWNSNNYKDTDYNYNNDKYKSNSYSKINDKKYYNHDTPHKDELYEPYAPYKDTYSKYPHEKKLHTNHNYNYKPVQKYKSFEVTYDDYDEGLTPVEKELGYGYYQIKKQHY